MPTEHEYKYVISLDLLNDHTEDSLLDIAGSRQYIQQGYLAFSKGMTTRIRSIRNHKKCKWFITFKQKVNNRVVEIEKKLDQRDGADLWSACVGKLTKERYTIEEGDHVWELDLFRKGEELYFILVEVELSEGSPRPKTVPKFLRKHVLYEVPLTDDRFSNKRLGDVDFATKLYRKIKKGTISSDR